MARIVIKPQGAPERIITLKSGVNRFGRKAGNDVVIEHPTISSLHCEIEYREGALRVRDCGSTNGTFLNDRQIEEGVLETGQKLRLGEVEMVVEDAEVTVAIPHVEVKVPAPPIVRTDGSVMCRQHEKVPATHRCTHCHEIMCFACVHRLRRRQGNELLLCPFCSFPVEPIGGSKKKKKSLVGYLFETVKMPIFGNGKKK